MAELNHEVLTLTFEKISSIVRLLKWFIGILIFVVAGGSIWMTTTDLRLSGVERGIDELTRGAVADLSSRVRTIEDKIVRGTLPVSEAKIEGLNMATGELDRRLSRIETRMELEQGSGKKR